MKEIESFYTFLEGHLVENGFDKIKESYTLSYWENYQENRGFLISKADTEDVFLVDAGGTVHINGQQIMYEDYEWYLNTYEQLKIRKSKFQYVDKEWKIEEYSLFNTLNRLYYKEIDSFYKELIKYINKNYHRRDYRNSIIKVINKVRFFSKVANSKKFSVKQAGEDKLLLFFYLDKLAKKIEDDYLTFNLEQENIEERSNSISKIFKLKTPAHYGFYFDKSKESTNINIILESIWKLLKSEGLIENRTKYAVFRNVFTSQKIKEKIVWLGDINQLYYFIKLLTEQTGYKHSRNTKKWEITINCFILPNNQTIKKEQLRFTNEPNPRKKIAILEVISQFNKLRCILLPILLPIYIDFYFK